MTKEYIEERSGGLYVAGTRVSLDSVVYQFQQGASPESILQSFPALRSLENIYGAITYYLAHQAAIEEYLKEQEKKWGEVRQGSDAPPPGLAERLERVRG
jgi:uncharacterized protein (DUF433 family)